MKNLLNLSNTWLVDGTFKLSPDIFYQIYTIHIELNGFAPPCVFVLLPNKTEKTYIRMIALLSEETNKRHTVLLMTFNWFYNYFTYFRTSWKNWITLNLIK